MKLTKESLQVYKFVEQELYVVAQQIIRELKSRTNKHEFKYLCTGEIDIGLDLAVTIPIWYPDDPFPGLEDTLRLTAEEVCREDVVELAVTKLNERAKEKQRLKEQQDKLDKERYAEAVEKREQTEYLRLRLKYEGK